ncbi:MAG: phosphotransferase enzyme family protein [Planctomycetota bacterium]|jgi:homoserine kinase type II
MNPSTTPNPAGETSSDATGSGSGQRPIGGSSASSGTFASHAPERAGFTASELLQVISRYDTGIIEGVHELPRGSSRAPKLILKTERGPLLLKRRASGRDNPARVSFTHGLHRHLESHGFQVPKLMACARDRSPSVHIGEKTYELFEFVPGQAFDHSVESTRRGGDALGMLHRLAAGFSPMWRPAGGGFHDQPLIVESLTNMTTKFDASGDSAAITRLRDAYEHARQQANASGIHAWPTQVIHGDWHPGNLLFKKHEVIAVLDFDTARVASRAEDLASGSLQFSLLRGERMDPLTWPDELDLGRFKAFCEGYDGVPGCRISVAELRAMAWLMIESLITEAVVPIAATGSFARMEGGAFLQMIDRKVQWIADHADTLREVLDEQKSEQTTQSASQSDDA